MSLKRPKICLLFCGGSTLVGRDDKPIEVNTKSDIANWLKEVPELKVIADIEPVFVFSGTTEKVSPEIWSILGQEIKKRYNQYDGFVITHNFDSIVYTGSALSYILQNLGKPVVLTGSQETDQYGPKKVKKIFGSIRRLGIRANLINAIQVATLDVAEVGIMFGNRFLRATQTQKTPTTILSFYDSPTGYLGKVDFGIKLAEDCQRRRKTALIMRPNIERKVLIMHLHPGMDMKSSLDFISDNAKGIFIQATDSAIQDHDIKLLEKYGLEKKTPIFIQRHKSEADKISGQVVNIPLMYPEASLVKVMWALGQTNSISKLRELMQENIANELITGVKQ